MTATGCATRLPLYRCTGGEHQAVVIPASEWPTYSSERFPAEIAAWQAQIDAQEQEQATPPNRAARRARGSK